MILLCRNESCTGHRVRAGSDPEGSCRFCGTRLADALGSLLVGADDSHAFAPLADLTALALCEKTGGHRWEGRVVDDMAAGLCSQCGLRIVLPVHG